MDAPDYEIVVSTENKPYLLWQALLFHASCVQTQGVAPTIVVHGDGPLLAGFRELGELGARVLTAPSYRMSGGGEYTARNTAGSLLEAVHERPWTMICDPDFLFLKPLPRRADELCRGRATSWDRVSYMQVGDLNRSWLVEACREQGVDPARVDEVQAGGVVPNFVRGDIHRDFAPRWVSAVDALVRVARARGDVPWVTIAWGFALAAWEMGLDLSLTELTHTTYDGERTPEGSLELPILHYCYGDESFDKRRYQGVDSAARVWSLRAQGTSVSARFLRELRAARDWFAERQLDVTNENLYRPGGLRKASAPGHENPIPVSPPEGEARYVDALPLLEASVGYGSFGREGDLGYEGKRVSVQGRCFVHALSVHAPSRLLFDLGGRYTRFRCQAALNDDVPVDGSRADFSVLADGRVVAVALGVGPGAPQTVEADVGGVARLELRVDTRRWEGCHSVWLDPEVSAVGSRTPATLVDCLKRVKIQVPGALLRTRRCVATVVSPGYAGLLDDLLGSLQANGNCPDARVVVFAIDADDECRRVIAKYGATTIECSPVGPMNSTLKAVLYSAARVIDASAFLCLDADMLVLGDLSPVFAALEACPEGTLLSSRETNGAYYRDVEHALTTVYYGQAGDVARIVGAPGDEGGYPLVVNDGLFAGSRAALLALDSVIRSFEQAPAWVDEHPHNSWRNQAVFNLAIARLRCGVELDATYNVQLFCNDVEMGEREGRLQATWQGRPVRVLHFNGPGRQKYPSYRGSFANVREPLLAHGAGDRYGEFLSALRAWVGRRGLSSLAWSFYGTADAGSARVADASSFPLLAALHYLIRSNGCVRVLETGTAHGVSAACLASAVAHRPGAKVVTFDPVSYPDRDELWRALPREMAACIEARQGDSLEGLAAALGAGERYEAALLDSIHSEEHVLAEFEIARRLVCESGLILIHDALLERGTVARALERIDAMGYGVTTLWAAESGVAEGERLGLAVIENRKRRPGLPLESAASVG